MVVINERLWDFLRNIYSSTVALKKTASGSITASIKMDEEDGTYVPVAMSNRSSIRARPMQFKTSDLPVDNSVESDSSDDSIPEATEKRTTIRNWAASPPSNRSLSAKDIVVEEANEDTNKEDENDNSIKKQDMNGFARPSIKSSVYESSEEEEIWLGSQVAPAVGLKNFGVNCYANAGLQCILSLSEITGYFLEEGYSKISYKTVLKTPTICKKLSIFYQEVFRYFI